MVNLNASSLNGATFASPGPIGSTTPDTGAFTTLTATSIGGGTTWTGNVISGQYGGTGVANTGKTITLGGDLTTSGAFATTIISTALTSVTLPTSGTLVGSNDTGAVTNTMLLNSTISGIQLGNNLPSLTIGSGLLGGSYNGSTAVTIKANPAKLNTLVASGATGTLNIDLSTSRDAYYTVDATANWTFNFRGNAGTTLDSILAVGESITSAIMITNGATPFYASSHQIDGSPVTVKYQGAPFSAGNANSIDQYTYKITKTASATFVVLASQVGFS